ncbi:MAG TPA: glycerol-3-phosphate 1-O-acyltransferase PlsY [Gemmatimonadaceae bacterium]|nr:glycerol-3-phosphate 1-O-acyltransferase PlsY [Gemmatimonadaceae bacterium]
MPAPAWLVVAYLLGSTPTALLAGRWMRGIDLRQYGSGNLGATNVYRVLGLPAALAVFAVDVAKGVVPVLCFPRWAGTTSPLWPVAFGVAAILGHIRPVYLGGKGGGKGVATASGVFFALAPVPMLVALLDWIIVMLLTRIVSLSSVFAAATLPFAVAIWYGPRSPLFPGAAAVAAFVVWTHRANLERLRAGREPRIGRVTAA